MTYIAGSPSLGSGQGKGWVDTFSRFYDGGHSVIQPCGDIIITQVFPEVLGGVPCVMQASRGKLVIIVVSLMMKDCV